MVSKYLNAVALPGQDVNPVFNLLGVRVLEITPERAAIAMPVRREHLQGAMVVAGGVMATLADEAMAHVVLANLEKGQLTTTIEMNLRFLRSAKDGELRAEARVVKKGRTVVTVEAEVMDGSGQVLARAGASFMVLDLATRLEKTS